MLLSDLGLRHDSAPCSKRCVMMNSGPTTAVCTSCTCQIRSGIPPVSHVFDTLVTRARGMRWMLSESRAQRSVLQGHVALQDIVLHLELDNAHGRLTSKRTLRTVQMAIRISHRNGLPTHDFVSLQGKPVGLG